MSLAQLDVMALILAKRLFEESLTPRLTGAGARSAEGTDMGHENAEGMAHVGVRVEPPVRRGSAVEAGCTA